MLKSLFSRVGKTSAAPRRREEPELRAQRRAPTLDDADDFALDAGFYDDEAPAAPPRRQPPVKAAPRTDVGARTPAAPRRATVKLSTIVGAAFGALMAGIGVNALALQKERHPAPWFKGASAAEPAKTSAAEPAPMPSPPPAAAAELAPAPAPTPQRPQAAPKPPERPHDSTASVDRRPRDPIGDLLKSGKTPAASIEPSAAVAAIQRTLVKLGYKVPVDGVIGPATSRAIARFEHDHRLPVKGQLTARLFQEINAAAKH